MNEENTTTCSHKWFTTGGMDFGVFRCRLCGEWGNLPPEQAAQYELKLLLSFIHNGEGPTVAQHGWTATIDEAFTKIALLHSIADKYEKVKNDSL